MVLCCWLVPSLELEVLSVPLLGFSFFGPFPEVIHYCSLITDNTENLRNRKNPTFTAFLLVEDLLVLLLQSKIKSKRLQLEIALSC